MQSEKIAVHNVLLYTINENSPPAPTVPDGVATNDLTDALASEDAFELVISDNDLERSEQTVAFLVVKCGLEQ
jgi:hypothetical protein